LYLLVGNDHPHLNGARHCSCVKATSVEKNSSQ
jgi:hypothetical protein